MQHRRNGFSSSLVLIAVLVLVSCAPRSTATPSPTEQAAAVEAMTVTPSATAAPTMTPWPTATATATPSPTPTLIPELQGLPLHPAPGELVRSRLKRGEVVNHPGLYFMRVDTGEIEGWTIARDHAEHLTFYSVSDDNRWVTAYDLDKGWLADRVSGAVYGWISAPQVPLLAAQGDHLVFSDGRHIWLVRGDLRVVAVLPCQSKRPQAVLSPDGSKMMLVDGGALFMVDPDTGVVRPLASVTAPAGSKLEWYSLGIGSLGREIMAYGHSLAQDGKEGDNAYIVRRFSWQGEMLGEDPHGLTALSPDGRWIAWEEDIDAVSPAVVVADAASLQPRFRVLGVTLCNPWAYGLGGRWLADSSGLVLRTIDDYRPGVPALSQAAAPVFGYRIVDVEGNLRPVVLPLGLEAKREVLPAPDRPDLFAVDRQRVIDASGKVLAEALLGDYVGMSPGPLDPWGSGSTELRFDLDVTGKGAACLWWWTLPPRVERFPFSAELALRVGLPADQCVSLYRVPASSEAITCVPGGSRLVVAPDKNATPVNLGPEGFIGQAGQQTGRAWLRVRTADGQEGWVDAWNACFAWAS